MSELARSYLASCGGDSPRAAYLRLLSAYYAGTQYQHLPRAWHENTDRSGQPIDFRQRRPSNVLPLPRQIVDTFCRALFGSGRRPKASIADTPGSDDDTLLSDLIAEAKIDSTFADATRRALATGSGIVVWKVLAGKVRCEAWDSAACETVFKPGEPDELESVDYRYTYSREVRDPQTGQRRPEEFWHRETITASTWVVYAEVEAREGIEPQWALEQTVEHDMGFCPAVWVRIGEPAGAPCGQGDGTGVFAPYLDLIDDLNYISSQQGRALFYALDPQVVLSGVAEGDVELLKGGKNAWTLPKDAKAELLESDHAYVGAAAERMKELRKSILDAAGLVELAPESVRGAHSGSALELLLSPQIARVDELREQVGGPLGRLLEQILAALGGPALAPARVRVEVRDRRPKRAGRKPRSPAAPRVVLTWGSHTPRTASDALTAADAATKATTAGAVSRESAARFLAPYMGVEDVEADQARVDADEKKQDRRTALFDARIRHADGLDIAVEE